MLAEVRIRSEFNYWLTDESCRERFRERLISPIAHLPWTERPVEYKLLRAWHAPATDVENWLQYTLVSCIRFKPIVLMNSNSRTSQCSVKHFLNPAKSHRIQWDPVVECVVAIRRDSLLFCMSRILSDLRIWAEHLCCSWRGGTNYPHRADRTPIGRDTVMMGYRRSEYLSCHFH